MQEVVDLGLRQRQRLVARADEAGHAGGVLDQAPGLVGHLHLDEDVAGHGPLLDVDLAAVLDLLDLLGRDHDLANLARLAHRLDPVLEVVLDLVLVA